MIIFSPYKGKVLCLCFLNPLPVIIIVIESQTQCEMFLF